MGAGQPRADEVRETLLRRRQQVLGEESWGEFESPLIDHVIAQADIWERAGLDAKTRSAVTLGVLVALRAEDELAMHVNAARNNGWSVEEISEILLHTAVYAGVPASIAGFKTARRALTRRGDLE